MPAAAAARVPAADTTAAAPRADTTRAGIPAGRGYASGDRKARQAMRGGASYHSYEGPHGTSVEHGTAAVQGAAAGPGGAAAGGKAVSGTEVTGPEGNTYTHESSAGRGVAAGPEGAEAGRYGETGGTVPRRRRRLPTPTEPPATAPRTRHCPPTPVMALPAAGAGSAAHAGYHQTEAVSGSVYAARGAAVRSSYNGYGMYGAGWHAANPGAWAAAGWTAGRAWTPATWPAVGATLGWAAGVQPVAYNYGNNVTYQDDQVYYGEPAGGHGRAVLSAGRRRWPKAAPAADATADDWMPLGVFALVQKEQSDPHYVMQLAVNKSGAIGGNYTDLISGTNVPIQGAVDKKTQRAAWTVGKNKTTVCETGIYNLTQDEAPALIHIGKDKTQQWLLVRLKQPEIDTCS